MEFNLVFFYFYTFIISIIYFRPGKNTLIEIFDNHVWADDYLIPEVYCLSVQDRVRVWCYRLTSLQKSCGRCLTEHLKFLTPIDMVGDIFKHSIDVAMSLWRLHHLGKIWHAQAELTILID